MNRLLALLCVVSIVLTSGCRARQLQQDQDKMRVAIIDMYSNQVMDNLIRAHRGFPFVQVDYSSVTGTITQDGRAGMDASFPEFAGDMLGVSLGGTQSNQLTVTANPLLNDDAVYQAYLRFALDPNKFVVTFEPPPCGAAHVCVGCEGMYYWVPIQEARAYQDLALRTTVMRGSPTATVRDYYVATIQGLVPEANLARLRERERGDEQPTKYTLFVQLKESVPNVNGTMQATVNGTVVTFQVEQSSDKQLNELGKLERKPGEPATGVESYDVVQIKFDYGVGKSEDSGFERIDARIWDLERDLPNQHVKIQFYTIRPTAPQTPEDQLGAIRREVELFRLNQQRTAF